MQLDKLSSTLALAAFEFDAIKINKPDVIKPFPKHRPQAFSTPGITTPEVTASTEVLVFIYLDPAFPADAPLVLPDNVKPVHFHSTAGRIRVARVPLASLGDLSSLPGILYLSASMQLKPLTDFSAVTTSLNGFSNTDEEVVLGVINSEFGSALAAFAGNIHSVWDQSTAGTGWGDKDYGKVTLAANLGAAAAPGNPAPGIVNVAKTFNDRFTNPNPNKVVIVKTDFQSARVADGIHYIFRVAQELGKPAVVIFGLDGLLDDRADACDLSKFIDFEKGQNFVVPPNGITANHPTFKAIKVNKSPNPTNVIDIKKFEPREISFVVSGVSHFVLRGWYESAGKCEIMIKSPDGGAKSTEPPETIVLNTIQDAIRYTKYKGSKVFLTVPVVSKVVSDRHEFFIDVRPLEANKLITAGTWNLLFKNYGTGDVNFTILSWVPEGETELKFS